MGEPDHRLGERVAAFVVLDSSHGAGFDLDACREWCAAQGAARFTWPERVVVVDRFPVLASGKADRARLAASL